MADTTPPVANVSPVVAAKQKLVDHIAWLKSFAGKDGYNPFISLGAIIALQNKLDEAAEVGGEALAIVLKQVNSLTRVEPTVKVYTPGTPPMPRTPGSQEIIQQQPQRGVQQLG